MANLKLSTKLSQQLVITPQLQQAIKILQMPIAELEEFVQEELLQNPVLEDTGKKSESLDLIQKKLEENTANESLDNTDFTPQTAGVIGTQTKYNRSDIYNGLENFVGTTRDLKDHLLWQARFLDISKEESAFVELLIYDINSDGYLESSIEELLEQYERIYPDFIDNISQKKAEELLRQVQDFDPPGVASRTVQECLLHQLIDLNIDDKLTKKIVDEYLDRIDDIDYLKNSLNVSEQDLEKSIQLIKSLEPKPGRVYNTTEVTYIVPDVYVYKYSDEYIVLLNDENIPQLRLSKHYLSLAEDIKALDKETRVFISEKIKEAYSVIKSIDHRQSTLKKVTEVIVRKQKDFFDNGIVGLKPLVLREIAEEISMHESTVSRVTSNKFIYTPHGIFELKFFLNNNISSSSAGFDLASEAIKFIIKELIMKENPENPLSDSKISYILKERNLEVARRTVAKYRESMGIPSSSKRKKGRS